MSKEREIDIQESSVEGIVLDINTQKNQSNILYFVTVFTTNAQTIDILIPSIYKNKILSIIENNKDHACIFKVKKYISDSKICYSWQGLR